MSEYMPKVGDRVRAALGETVVVGEVEEWGNSPDTGYVSITPLGLMQRSSTIRCWRGDGWRFEQVVEVPTKFGAVIRRADGRAFSLADPGAHDDRPWVFRSTGVEFDQWTTTPDATEGGFVIEFEGVDE